MVEYLSRVHLYIKLVKTHPDSIDRIRHLLSKYHANTVHLNDIISTNYYIKEMLMDLISTNFDLFEFYGSVYLGQWHKIVKKDRIDY